MAIISDKIEFVGHDGVSRLAARFDSPERGLRASALFAHCFTCSKDIRAATRIARALAERGFGVLRFDFTGLGASEGEFANTDFSSNVQDLVAAARFMESSQGHGPDVLVGHSLGGAAVLAAAGEISSVKAVATIGAPAEPGHVAHLFRGKAEEITAAGAAEVEIAGRVFTVTKRFLDDISEQRLEENLAALRKALLIFHGPRDDTVGIENAAMIFAAARHPKSFVSLDDADHLLSREADAIYVAKVLAAWAGRYIEDGAAEAETGEEAAPDKGVTVTEAGSGRFTQDIIAGGHRLVADEPKAFGGDERGPGPYDLLLAGLGACTSMTLRMYAERKGWPLERASVSLSHEKVHAEDCENCEEPGGRIDRIERTIRLDGPLDAAQRARMLEIADKCPVHKTLTGTIEILTREDES
ncbi:MAG: alpha/beta fold hydrolase [Alphaproteobacteria bacterium]|nr:alpha/beta fold hydrolase [Alphaproteobacteria bacterium]